MSDTPETQEAVERWNQGKINIFDEMARLERERDEAREIIRRAKTKFCEEGSDGNIASDMFAILSTSANTL